MMIRANRMQGTVACLDFREMNDRQDPAARKSASRVSFKWFMWCDHLLPPRLESTFPSRDTILTAYISTVLSISCGNTLYFRLDPAHVFHREIPCLISISQWC